MDIYTSSIIIGLIAGAISAYFASKRGRSPIAWFIIGFLFGLIGLIVLFIMPKRIVEEEIVEETETPQQQVEATTTEESLPEEEKVDGLDGNMLYQEWYYLNEKHEQQGPVSFEDLTELLQNGTFSEMTYVWTEGWTDWHRVKEYIELKCKLKA